jgi:hypothetical protein
MRSHTPGFEAERPFGRIGRLSVPKGSIRGITGKTFIPPDLHRTRLCCLLSPADLAPSDAFVCLPQPLTPNL